MTRPRRTALVFVLLAVAAVTMLVFEATITRVVGVLALFGFIVAGTFAIADHEFLDPDADAAADATGSANDGAATVGTRRAQER